MLCRGPDETTDTIAFCLDIKLLGVASNIALPEEKCIDSFMASMAWLRDCPLETSGDVHFKFSSSKQICVHTDVS
jgi:hypothetical protein